MTTLEVHGQPGKNPNWAHCRWCAVHNQYHGSLYKCPFYSKETLDEIARETSIWGRNLKDPDYIQKLIQQGVPPEGIAILKFFAGTENGKDTSRK